MKYNDIKTPEQLLKYMDENIKYGFVDDNEKIYGPWNNQEFQQGCQTNWRLSSPERLIKVRYGHCFDQVELERDWFNNHNYNFKTFYIMFELPFNNSYSMHTYLVFEKDGKYYYFEHSDFKNRGMHIYEYTNPTYGCTMKEFISNILENGKEAGNENNMGRVVDL